MFFVGGQKKSDVVGNNIDAIKAKVEALVGSGNASPKPAQP
jgi:hypothetical protein